jgi:hypothetical protein
LVGKSEGKIPTGRTTRISGNNTKVYLDEIWREDVKWIEITQIKVQVLALVNTKMNIYDPCKVGKSLIS